MRGGTYHAIMQLTIPWGAHHATCMKLTSELTMQLWRSPQSSPCIHEAYHGAHHASMKLTMELTMHLWNLPWSSPCIHEAHHGAHHASMELTMHPWSLPWSSPCIHEAHHGAHHASMKLTMQPLLFFQLFLGLGQFVLKAPSVALQLGPFPVIVFGGGLGLFELLGQCLFDPGQLVHLAVRFLKPSSEVDDLGLGSGLLRAQVSHLPLELFQFVVGVQELRIQLFTMFLERALWE